MKNYLRLMLLIGFSISAFYGIIVIFNDSFLQTVFASQEEFSGLQTGIISTENNDYAISNNFQTRILQDGKIMRISGITITGESYYVYQKFEDDTLNVKGKILVNGIFVPVVYKKVLLEQEIPVKSKTDLIMAVELSKYTYSNYPFLISVKVFDVEKNPQAKFEDKFGVLENVLVNVTITNRFEKFVTSISGNTNSLGIFSGRYLVNEGIVGQGKFNVNVLVDDGISSTSKSFTTFFRGDIRNYFDKN